MTARAIDVDGHVIEPPDLWLTRIEASHRQSAPRPVLDRHGVRRLEVEGRVFPTPEGPGRAPRVLLDAPARRRQAVLRRAGQDPTTRLAWMDEVGVAASLLLPSQALVVGAIADAGLAAAVARAYNDWLADLCGTAPLRLLGAAVVPLQDPDAAVTEADRALGELGLAGVTLRPEPVDGASLCDVSRDELYAVLEERGAPLLVHGACGFAPGVTAGVDRFENGLFSHVVSHPVEQALAVLAVTAGGVLERHPRLRVAFLEGGVGWLPSWLDRLDDHVRLMGWEVPWLHELPSAAFARQCVVGVAASDRDLGWVAQRAGPQVLAWASDFPHVDHSADDLPDRLRSRTDITATVRDAVLAGNAAALLGRATPGPRGHEPSPTTGGSAS